MNVLLLGNGFDLNLNLPTAYIDFLDTVDFIREHKLNQYKTIADLWASQPLRNRNKNIENAYCRYCKVYANTPLPENFVWETGRLAEENIWFRYLVETFNKNVGWIDFEREIQAVIQSFQSVLDQSKGEYIHIHDGFSEKMYIVLSFNFFASGGPNEKYSMIKGGHPVKEEYLIEYPLGSGHRIINKEKIIGQLYNGLIGLVRLLRTYLEVFIDTPLKKAVEMNLVDVQRMFECTNQAITLNYTHSFEILYPSINVIHVHGEVGKNIVLGVNSDENDEQKFANTEYIAFKKYFQRLVYGTDKEYLSFLKSLRECEKPNSEVALSVMGHSLDVSDRDIITELFSISSSITILYHNQSALGSHVRNLVRLFGKSGLDELRTKKNLRFHCLADEASYIEEQGAEIFEKALYGIS